MVLTNSKGDTYFHSLFFKRYMRCALHMRQNISEAILISGVAARVFESGGQKVDKTLNLPHYAWMTDKIVRPKELLIPPKNSPLYLKL